MGRRDRSYDYDSSSSGSESDDRRSYGSKSSSRRKGGSSSKGRSSRRRDKSRDRARTPEPPPRIPEPAKAKPPKIAMVLLLGQDEVEFKLTEAHLLFDSPNDLTSTYYADNSGEVRTYRMPDRDAAIFQIIFRYMNREIVLPLRKASIPKYLSYEQTEAKLAEEAKFYRLTRLMRMLPPPPSAGSAASGPGVGNGAGAPAGSGASSASYASSIAESDRSRTLSDIHPPPIPQAAAPMNMPQTLTPYHANMPLPPQMQGMPGMPPQQASGQTLVPPATAMPQYQQQVQQQPYPQQQYAQPGAQMAMPMATPNQGMPSATTPYTASQTSLPPTAVPTSHAPSPMHLQPPPRGSRPPRTARSETSYSDRLRARSGTRSRRESVSSHSMIERTSSPGSRRQSISSIAAKLPSNALIRPPATVFAYLFKSGGHSITKNEPAFPIIGFPDREPLPHLFVKATAAEIKFSAFRNAEDNELFEMRYSIRILDEPATRPLAYRVKDTTIKSIDSHLRLNGVITDIECRDIPIRIKHSVPAVNASGQAEQRIKGALSAAGNIIADDDGSFTSGFDELLELMTTKGYVKWPRIWQDTFTNITAVESLHQRVCLTSCEVLLDIEFPEEAAAISEAVGGRGYTLNEEDQDDLLVRNYRVTLHGIKVETRKMRRLRELEELDPEATPRSHELPDAKVLETPKPPTSTSRSGVPPYSANARANLIPSNASVSASTMLDRARVSRDIINYPETPLPTSSSRGRSARPPEPPVSEGLLTPRPPHRSASGSRGPPQSARPPPTPSSYASSAGSYDDEEGDYEDDDDGQSLAPSSIPPTPKASRGRPPAAAAPKTARTGGHLAPPEQLRTGREGGSSSRGRGGYAPSTYTTDSRASGMSGMSGASGTDYTASIAPSGYSEGSRRSEWSDVYSESGQSDMSRDSRAQSRYSRSSAPSLKVPPSEYSVDRRRSTASEDIKRRAMARWK